MKSTPSEPDNVVFFCQLEGGDRVFLTRAGKAFEVIWYTTSNAELDIDKRRFSGLTPALLSLFTWLRTNVETFA